MQIQHSSLVRKETWLRVKENHGVSENYLKIKALK